MVLMHEIKPTHRHKAERRIGRGGKRGTYSGRGQKGQRARAGRKIRSQERESLSKIPKKRGQGFDQRHTRGQNIVIVKLPLINRVYREGEIVSPQTLMAKNLVRRRFSHQPKIKILGHGELTKRLVFKGCEVSKAVREKIAQAGGKC